MLLLVMLRVRQCSLGVGGREEIPAAILPIPLWGWQWEGTDGAPGPSHEPPARRARQKPRWGMPADSNLSRLAVPGHWLRLGQCLVKLLLFYWFALPWLLGDWAAVIFYCPLSSSHLRSSFLNRFSCEVVCPFDLQKLYVQKDYKAVLVFAGAASLLV